MYLTLVVLAVLLVLGYRLSLRLHPYRACWWCRGSARHRGAVFTRAHRPCRHCGGAGRVLRFGARA